MSLTYGSVCSGIEAATAAWHPLGWTPAWFAEVDPFPSAVLAHHYPQVTNYGDFTPLLSPDHPRAAVDVLVGGTPCQDFSIAGLRAGLAGHRGNLTMAFVALARALRPRWIVWENVPGVLSIDGGRAFGAFLGGLAECGYGFAYRVLDAQYFGLAQRRKRVFVVGHLGDWRRAAAVLLEPEGVRWDSPPRRQAGTRVAGALASGLGSRGADDNAGACLAKSQRLDFDVETFIARAFNWQSGGDCRGLKLTPVTGALSKKQTPAALSQRGVRRLMPHEMERLQGFADNYTRIPYRGRSAEDCPDGPRAKALGNSMAVPVMAHIGRRIVIVDALTHEQEEAAK